MAFSISNNTMKILACSTCGHELKKNEAGLSCPGCGLEYQFTRSGSLDLRLKKIKNISLDFNLGAPLLPDNGFQVKPLSANTSPEVTFSTRHAPFHLSKEVLSYFPKAKTQDSLMLDLGCGNAIHKDVCEQAGFEWVGLDYDSAEAPILGDAHSLPFTNNSFEFILSIAVLEHIRFPFVMMKEAYRVLKPGGKFIGSVAFLEPFHADSFYHHTHLGIYNALQYGGFTIEKLAPYPQWDVLRAQAEMALFPRMPGLLSRAIVLPIQLFHRFWWWVGSSITPRSSRGIRILTTSGSFTFIATKGVA